MLQQTTQEFLKTKYSGIKSISGNTVVSFPSSPKGERLLNF